MSASELINYIELPASNLAATKRFFTKAFGWEFVDYGDQYAAIQGAGLDGGFYASGEVANAEHGSALVVLYSKDLADCQQRVEQSGGHIKKPVFEFPGGRRFHFTDPSGNEFAVWSDQP